MVDYRRLQWSGPGFAVWCKVGSGPVVGVVHVELDQGDSSYSPYALNRNLQP